MDTTAADTNEYKVQPLNKYALSADKEC